MRIAFGTDEATNLTRGIVGGLVDAGYRVDVLADGDAWPDAGRRVGGAVAAGRADLGIVCSWTGTGVSNRRQPRRPGRPGRPVHRR